jgi:hypothetical protein
MSVPAQLNLVGQDTEFTLPWTTFMKLVIEYLQSCVDHGEQRLHDSRGETNPIRVLIMDRGFSWKPYGTGDSLFTSN